MGLFDKEDEKAGRNEVRVNVPSDRSSDGTNGSKLKSEVESKVSSGSRRRSSTGSKDTVDMDDIYRQNEKIIDLLQQIADSSEQKDRSSSKSRETRSNKNTENAGVGSDMNELL